MQHWLLVAGGWAFGERSAVQAAQAVRARATALASARRRGERPLREELAELQRGIGGSFQSADPRDLAVQLFADDSD